MPRRRHDARARVAHYAAPALFLLGVTIAVLLIRAGLQQPAGTTTTSTRPVLSTGATTATTRAAGSKRRFYTVQTGDSLTSIADSLALTGGWTALYVENQQVIGDDPNLILPGERLLVDVGSDGETGE